MSSIKGLNIFWIHILIVFIIGKRLTGGDLEPTFARCCALGANWARERQNCMKIPAPIPSEPSENQSMCITAASICCLRFYRESQCESAKQAAKSGSECSVSSEPGGEYFKDCCDGCKLGLISGSLAMKCSFKGFSFGYPWNAAYHECCIQALPPGAIDQEILSSETNIGMIDQKGVFPDLDTDDENFLFTNRVDGDVNIPDSENLCLLFPGQLCGHVCVPTRGSYVCQCRAGFTLSVDGKTCIQTEIKDRCEANNPCDHICRDTGVSIECSCNLGYHLALDQRSCNDINECKTEIPKCGLAERCINFQGGYECKVIETVLSVLDCPPGYKMNSQTNICEVVDACATEPSKCSPQERCVSNDGSYKCVPKSLTCNSGFAYDEQEQMCKDIDECTGGLHLCSIREKCINLEGAYRCDPLGQTDPPQTTSPTTSPAGTTVVEDKKFGGGGGPGLEGPLESFGFNNCGFGYVYDQSFSTCKDIDECLNLPCDKHELCLNTPGSFECDCSDGFARDSSTGDCKDINECQLGLHTCERLQRCDNTLGSYTCTRISGCGTGYTLNHHTGTCEDDDECQLGTNDCRQLGPKWTCVNTKGSFRCEKKTCPETQILNSWGLCVNITCTPGYKPSFKKCVDINECIDGESPCKRNERCFNLVGSLECRPKINCGRGYTMNEDGNQCIDIDECEDGSHTCSASQLCLNRPGGYVCQCPQGYRLDANRECQDINECQTAYASLCGNTGKCENTPGSYRCICREGFKKTPGGETCIDIDECSEVENVCEHNCINVWGSHYCTCNAGYIVMADNRTCADIDECEEIRGRGRLCLGLCVNTPGTFKCSCPDGYRLEDDQRTCKDINECDTIGKCRNPEDICVNTRGGFKCQKISCPPNYVRDQTHRNRCKKETLCLEDDLACLQRPLTYSYNFLPLASNMTLRPLGQVDLFTMRGPLWSSTNVQFDLEFESVSVGSEGVTPASKVYFILNRTAFNQVVLTLIKSLEGPQEVQLNLNMKLYHNGYYEGSAVAKLLIFVSEYDF